MSYQHFDHCLSQLAGVTAIDFFLAQQLAGYYHESENDLFFHTLLALSDFQRQGHSCMPLSVIADRPFWQTFDDSRNEPANGFVFPGESELLSLLQRVLIPYMQENVSPVVLEDERLYLRRYWKYETEVAARLAARINFTALNDQALSQVKAVLEQCYPEAMSLQESGSKIAVANALGRDLCIVTGGPGTGKTFTATRLLLALLVLNPASRIRMAAPTGKAAQRLNESIAHGKSALLATGLSAERVAGIPESAQTIHRLLGYRPDQVQPRYHEEHPLHCDVLLLDEVSMIDLPMLCRILRALPPHTTLIMLGDANQLPSVEVGNILAEMVGEESGTVREPSARQIKVLTGFDLPTDEAGSADHVAWLKKSWRFSGEIADLANRVYAGDGEGSWAWLSERIADAECGSEPHGEVVLLPETRALSSWLSEVADTHYLPVLKATTLDAAFQRLAAFRILTPMRVGPRGVDVLNREIETALGRKQFGVSPGKHYKGRPIMVTENHYGVRLFNGDVGVIWPDAEGKLVAWFETERDAQGRQQYRSVSLARLPNVEPVYAMTIHKTQGSEFGHVALVLPEQDAELLSRQLLYTGITRARARMTLFSSEAIWRKAVHREAVRYSGLGRRIQRLLESDA